MWGSRSENRGDERVVCGVAPTGFVDHLEWLELCTSRLDADGVVLALADFPRTDGEYAAQVKKVAVDLGNRAGRTRGAGLARPRPPR